MKRILPLIFLFNCVLVNGQSNFCPRYVFDGVIVTNKNLQIELSFTVLLDSTLVGSYFYQPNHGSLQLAGHLNQDNSFVLFEWDKNDSLTGKFVGKLTDQNKKANGIWTSQTDSRSYRFYFYPSENESHWDYIRKNRSYYEYTSIESAITNFDIVKSIDLSSSDIYSLPKELSKLTKIESINLLDNNFKEFPEVLTELQTLDEISLSSNELTSIPTSIGKLKNLRILYVNFNNLTSIPKEIGQLENLLYLDLGNNNLTTLPSEIRNLKKLEELYIDGSNNFSAQEKRRIKELLPNCVVHF